MRTSIIFSSALLCTSLLGLTPAFADFTPNDALNRYMDLVETTGLTVTVEEESETDGTVRWAGITVTDKASMSISELDWLEASPMSEDTVKIVFGSNLTLKITDVEEDMPPVNLRMDLVNNEAVLTENGELLDVAFSGDRMLVTTVGSDPEFPLEMNISVSDIGGEYSFEGDDHIDGLISLGAMEMVYGIDDGKMKFASESSIAATYVKFSADLPDEGEYGGFLSGEQNVTFDYSFAEISSFTSFAENGAPEGSISSDATLTAGTFAVSDGAFAMLGEAQDLSYNVNAPIPGFPPMSAQMDSMSMNMNMTFGEAGEVAPFGLAIDLAGLTVDDSIWGMFDPSGAIPKDPATLRLDLGGDLLWTVDDLEAAMDNNEPPFIPQTAVLRELFLSIGGAQVSASGEGMLSQQTGEPSGSAIVELKGVMQLIQTLSEIGLVPLPQAMMAQAMMPQFTKPGPDGPDHLISEIEASPDGSVMINGTRIK